MGSFRPRWIICLTLLLTLSVAMMSAPAPAALAQDTAAPTPSSDQGSQPIQESLIQAVLQELPANPALIRLVRITLQPGASVPSHAHPGPEFGRVENGILTVRVDGEVVIAQRPVDGTAQPPRVPPVSQDFDLVPGDQIVYPTGVPISMANRTQDPVTVLSAVIYPAGEGAPPASVWTAGTPGPDTMAGVSSIILGDAVAPGWPEPPYGVFIDRLVLAPGESIPPVNGPVMLAVELGQFGFALVDGEFQLSRGNSGPLAVATPGVPYVLSPGDAVFFPGGMSEVPRTANDGVLVVVRLAVVNATALVGDATGQAPADTSDTQAPAAETPAAGDPTTQTQTQTEQPANTGAGNATINETGVRIRDTPSVSGAVVAQLDTGRAIVITGEPVEGDGINWYPIQVADDPGVTGFIAEGFFDSAP